ncbi:MAG: hypothetical protein HGA27_05940 [Peptococcaceae bacterium]|nr:hypothetical protein [Peptococcaceae bacterium]
MKKIQVEAGSGKYKVELYAQITDNGIMLNLTGGEKPHLGAVVVSIPGPGLSENTPVSCSTTVVPLVGHRDDRAAKPLAEMVAKELKVPVSVAAGLHIKNADSDDIKILLENSLECGRKLLEQINS